MSAASRRRNLRRENVRELSQREPGLSRRQIGERLGISKDTVRRDLDALAREAGAEIATPSAPDAPQVSEGGAPSVAPDAPAVEEAAAPDAPPADPAQDEPVEPVLRIRLTRRPRLLASLTALLDVGLTAPAVIDTVLAAFVGAYGQALDRGELSPGDRYQVTVRVRRAV